MSDVRWYFCLTLMTAPMVANANFASRVCGLNGTIVQRIAHCNESTGLNGEFQLVTRMQNGNEIYRGRKSGVIWSADVPAALEYLDGNVARICQKNLPQMGGLTGLQWKLPSIHRFIQGLDHRLQDILPSPGTRVYWSSTAPNFYVNSRYVFEGGRRYVEKPNGKFEFRFYDIEGHVAYVKCIVEPGN